MFEIIKKHIHHAPNRKNYYIKWKVFFEIDRSNYQVWALLPTIVWCPWYYRSKGMTIFDIQWFNWHIGIGEWNVKENNHDHGNY